MSLKARIIRKCDSVASKMNAHGFGSFWLGRKLVDLLLLPSDLEKIYRHHQQRLGRKPNLLRPDTFNDWIQRSKLLCRYPRYIEYADKVRVRDFVMAKGFGQTLTKLYWTGTDLLEARNISLPDRFVIKCNNGSGTNILVKNAASLDWTDAAKRAAEWFGADHSIYHAEWQYRWIKPQVMIEEFLESGSGEPPFDYKFHCFNGRAEIMQVDLDRFSNHTRAMFDRGFNRLPFTLEYPAPIADVQKPPNFEKMLEIADALSAGEKFLRVDLYDLGDRIVFGELTLHPGAGHEVFTPSDWDKKLYALFADRHGSLSEIK